VATGVIAELGDLSQFDHPRKLMSYLGLVPSEHSSGDKRHLGTTTKCGNSRARRLLAEGAHSYKHNANISKEMQLRQEGLSKEIIDMAWQAQLGQHKANKVEKLINIFSKNVINFFMKKYILILQLYGFSLMNLRLNIRTN
ncbi:MAG: transposase, partial [Polaribacter sp.]